MAEQKYEIITRIGTGGMAEVFKASSTSLKGFKKPVAIKRVLPSLTEDERFVRMFLDEAKIALPLNHSNIVQTFDLGLADETYFIVMEYVAGTTLKEMLQTLAEQGERLSALEAALIARDICKGLSHAHERVDSDGDPMNIVHRDISPPNILLSYDGEVKITDFGLAKAKSQAELTDPGVVKGKFGYLSPEAARGEDIDARTDLFAVGILLWEMLTGERLFLAETDQETLEMVQSAQIRSLESVGRRVPPSLKRIVERALQPERQARYQDARQLGRDLAGFLASQESVVTSFDLSRRVEALAKGRQPRSGDSSLGPADLAVQREINQFVSVEEIQDLDLRMADQDLEEVSTPVGESEDFEDPRDWSDFGFDDEELEVDENELPSPVDESDEDWQEHELKDVARATRSMPAVDGGAAPSETSDASDRSEQSDREQSDTEEDETDAAGASPVVVALVVVVVVMVMAGAFFAVRA